MSHCGAGGGGAQRRAPLAAACQPWLLRSGLGVGRHGHGQAAASMRGRIGRVEARWPAGLLNAPPWRFRGRVAPPARPAAHRAALTAPPHLPRARRQGDERAAQRAAAGAGGGGARARRRRARREVQGDQGPGGRGQGCAAGAPSAERVSSSRTASHWGRVDWVGARVLMGRRACAGCGARSGQRHAARRALHQAALCRWCCLLHRRARAARRRRRRLRRLSGAQSFGR